jgi:hypothetical protein
MRRPDMPTSCQPTKLVPTLNLKYDLVTSSTNTELAETDSDVDSEKQ